MAVAVAAANLAVRHRAPGSSLLEGLLTLPWAVPGTVFAVALATVFSVSSPWTGRFVLIGTLWLLPLAYLIRSLPMAGRAVMAGYRQLDPSLEEAAAALGRGAVAYPPAGDAAAAAARPGGRCHACLRHGAGRFRHLDRALHVRHPADFP